MKKKTVYERTGGVIAALVLWQVVSMILNQKLLMVSPFQVILRLGSLWMEQGFWRTIGYSFIRIEAGFFLGLFGGSLLAVISSRFHLVEMLLWPYVVAAKSVPVASFIIISLIWLRASGLAVFISFLIVFPVIYFNVLQGMKSTDEKLLQMAALYRMPWHRQFLYIYLPQVRPFLVSACATALGMAWKAGIAAEVIGIPGGSIGERLYEAKIYLNTAELFAWTVVIVLISVLFEKLFMRVLKWCFARMECTKKR